MAKSYTENSSVNNLDFKQSCRAASTNNLSLSGTQTVDGVSLSVGDRVLVKSQTTASQNGIYLVSSGSWSRSLDCNENSEITSNFIVFIEEGTINSDTGWILTSDNPVVIGETSLVFSCFSGKFLTMDSGGNVLLTPVNNGNVGIGTSTPNSKLHVYSSVVNDVLFRLEGTSGSLFSVVDSTDGSLMSVNDLTGLPALEVFNDHSIIAGRFNQNDFVVSSSGNVGVGTNSPSAKLHVSGNTASTSTATGTLVVTGGVGVSGDINAGGEVRANELRSNGGLNVSGSCFISGDVELNNNNAVLYLDSTLASTSTSTGGIRVPNGGVGIGGNINVGGTVNRLTGGTASTSTATGTLVVTGGVGIGGNINAGSIQNTPIGNTTRNTGAFTTLTSNGATTFTAGTASTSTATGTLVVTGGVGVSGTLSAGGLSVPSINSTPIGNSTPSSGAFTTLTSNGATTLTANTASTSTATGTLVVTGGVGVSGAIYAGSIQNTPIGSTTRNTGAFTTLTSNGATTLTANTASTSTATGTLVVTGGVGVSGNLNVGGSFSAGNLNANDMVVAGNLTVSGNTTILNTETVRVEDHNIELGNVTTPTDTTANGGGITLKGATDKTLTWSSSTNAWTSNQDFNLVSGKVYEINGTQVLSSNQLGSAVTFNSNTASTSTSTGTLVVTGGVGVSGTLSAGALSVPSINSTPIGNATASTGAFTTLTSNGATTFTAGTASTSTSTGTLVVTGGVGVSGDLNIGSSIVLNTSGKSKAHFFNFPGNYANILTDPIVFGTNDTTYRPIAINYYQNLPGIVISTTGNVGVGSNTPSQKLHVLSSVDSDSSLLLQNTNAGTSARTSVNLNNGAYSASISLGGQGFTNNGFFKANRLLISGPFINDYVSGQHVFNIGGGGTAQAVSGSTQVGWWDINSLYVVNGIAGGNQPSSALNLKSTAGVGTTDHIKFSVGNNGSTEAVRIINNGNVGIGTSTPTYKLQVSGSFGATTKSFRIDHPSKSNFTLEYGSLESPYHGVRLTGRGKVVSGIGTVNLPYYLKDLIHDDDDTLTVQITNYKHGKSLYVSEIDLKNDLFKVKGDRCKTAGVLEFFWSLTGVRKDVDLLVVEQEK